MVKKGEQQDFPNLEKKQEEYAPLLTIRISHDHQQHKRVAEHHTACRDRRLRKRTAKAF